MQFGDFNFDLMSWVIIPLLIFIARVVDVSMGTLRIIFISKGKRIVAPILGFLEIIIWLLAIGQIFKNLNNVACYVAYAGGFATGNYVGLLIEKKLALGMQVVRIITRMDATQLIERLKKEGYGLTIVDAEGMTGPVKIIFTIIKRKDLSEVLNFVDRYNPRAFYSVEDVRTAREGIYPRDVHPRRSFWWNVFKFERKGK
ncbi:MAG: DUF2179 domain-containing protein [Calditrichia bacterium]